MMEHATQDPSQDPVHPDEYEGGMGCPDSTMIEKSIIQRSVNATSNKEGTH